MVTKIRLELEINVKNDNSLVELAALMKKQVFTYDELHAVIKNDSRFVIQQLNYLTEGSNHDAKTIIEVKAFDLMDFQKRIYTS